MKTKKKLTRAECEKNGGDLSHPNYHARWKALVRQKPHLIKVTNTVGMLLRAVGSKRGVYSLLADKSPVGAFEELVRTYRRNATLEIDNRYGLHENIGGVTKEAELTSLAAHCADLQRQFADLIA